MNDFEMEPIGNGQHYMLFVIIALCLVIHLSLEDGRGSALDLKVLDNIVSILDRHRVMGHAETSD